jgi:hypothetical protein
MKLTKDTIKKIIKEEIENLQNETTGTNTAESYKLNLDRLKKIGAAVKKGDSQYKAELAKAIQILGKDLEKFKLNPSGPHAMFYYAHVGLVDTSVDMSKIVPDIDDDRGSVLSELYPKEKPEFY